MKTSTPSSSSSAVPWRLSGLVVSAYSRFASLRPGPAAVERAALVAADDPARAGALEDPGHRHAGGAAAGRQDADVLDPLADDAESVEKRREHDDRRPVLVVVEDGDVEALTQPPLDLEAARRRDVLEVDPAERGRDHLNGADDLVRVLRVEADRERVDAGELLEQDGLALHHRHRPARPDVAEPEDGGAVAHDRDGVALDRQVPDLLRVVGDRPRYAGDTGGVRHRQVLARLDRDARPHLELPAEMEQEGAVGDVDDLDALDLADGVDDQVEVVLVVGEDRDVADLRRLLDADEVDRSERAARFADRRRQARERAGPVVDAHADGGAE